jgi:hypothetical protein
MIHLSTTFVDRLFNSIKCNLDPTIMNLQYVSDNKGKKTGVFIPIEDWEILLKHLNGLDNIEFQEPTKAEILEGLKNAFNEVKLHREGKIKLNPARELLHEL